MSRITEVLYMAPIKKMSVIKEQRDIGWKMFLEGIISPKYAQYINFYFSTKKSNKMEKLGLPR